MIPVSKHLDNVTTNLVQAMDNKGLNCPYVIGLPANYTAATGVNSIWRNGHYLINPQTDEPFTLPGITEWTLKEWTQQISDKLNTLWENYTETTG